MNEAQRSQANTTTDGLSIWKLDDCEYVVAHSRDEAVQWYEKEIKGEPVNEIEEAGWDELVNIADEGEPHVLIPFRESVLQDLRNGQTPPFIAGVDGYYV